MNDVPALRVTIARECDNFDPNKNIRDIECHILTKDQLDKMVVPDECPLITFKELPQEQQNF